ncbi:hypothetical protein VTO42DRAFT_4685 [Malbranchea cinnamomea]
MEWLEQVNPHIDWVEKTWRYRFELENIDVVSRVYQIGLHNVHIYHVDRAEELPSIDGPTYAIKLKEGAEPPYMLIYNLSQKELEILQKGLNSLTIKNPYPLSLIDEILDPLQGVWFFTKLDLWDTYHRICIREADEWKTTFHTSYTLTLLYLACLMYAVWYTWMTS